jgi:integrase
LDEHWQRCLESYLRHLYDRSGSGGTVYAYRSILRRFFETVTDPSQVSRQVIEDFIHRPIISSYHHGQPPSPATRNRRLAILSSFYTYASRYTIASPDGRVAPLYQASNPTLGITRGKVAPTYHAFTAEELIRFFATIPRETVIGARDRAIFLTYFYTARRRDEIARLRYGDIQQTMLFDPDGSRRTGWTYRWRGKGQARGAWDQAELPAPAYLAIEEYLVFSGRRATIGPNDPVFVAIGPEQGGGKALDPNRPLSGVAIWYRLKHYCTRAGLDADRLSLHSLRHTSARERYNAGEGILRIKELLRHASLNTTFGYLLALSGSADPEAKFLEDKFRGL